MFIPNKKANLLKDSTRVFTFFRPQKHTLFFAEHKN